MDQDVKLIRQLYVGFNGKRIGTVLALLTEDVMWANAMDGGHVQGHSGIREYWTRQWSTVDPHVQPIAFRRDDDSRILVEVVQTIRDLQGKVLQDQTHGLTDKVVTHRFTLENGYVARFDVLDV